jgi:hypothetical protein
MKPRLLLHSLALAFGLSGIGALSSCSRAPDPPSFEKRCLAGDQLACAKACADGVLGPGGCLAAAKVKNPLRKTEMYTRACHANVPEACAAAAEASVTLSLSNPAQYQRLLEHGCELSSRKACEMLGDFSIVESLDTARRAYAKACEAERAAPDPSCTTRMEKLATLLAEQRAACLRDDVGACEQLLYTVADRNHDLGYQAADRLCRLRGLERYYQKTQMPFAHRLRSAKRTYTPCGLFLLARAARDPKRESEFRRVPLPETVVDRGERIVLSAVELHFREPPSAQPEAIAEAKRAIEAELRARLDVAQRCYELRQSSKPVSRAGFSADFGIDKLGEPLELRPSGAALDPAFSACLLSGLVPERFAASSIRELGSIVHVEVRYELTAPDRGNSH